MKQSTFLRLFIPILAIFCFSAIALAQDGRPPDNVPQDANRPAANQGQDPKVNILRQLDLSREQFQQIRRINAERKPLMDEATMRLRMANRALDEAIYADQVNDQDVQARLKDFQLAQAEVAKVRFINELWIRKILTPDQLIRFRDLRQRFEKARETMQTAPPGDGKLPPGDVKARQNDRQLIKSMVRQNQKRP